MQGLDSGNGCLLVNNSVVPLSSFSSKDAVGRSTTQCDVIDTGDPAMSSSDPYNKRTVEVSTGVVSPSAIVSGGTMTLPTRQQTVNGSGRAVSPWQRVPVSRAPTGSGGGSCSYGVSSPCCKLLPSATVATSSHTPSACQLRSVTLPRGHPASYSGEIAARLKPPPPPSAAAIRQATQRACLLGGHTSKTLDTRARSHGRAVAGSKTNADSNVEQRKSVSTVIV